jgi:endonuclease YncB( thermonuclease family)
VQANHDRNGHTSSLEAFNRHNFKTNRGNLVFGLAFGLVELMVRKLLVLTLVVVFFVASQALADLSGQARVIDGDTIELKGQKVRLYGIDAPESDQDCYTAKDKAYQCGRLATGELTKLIGGKKVTCKGGKLDRYGRLVSTCYFQGIDINQQMVLNGWALAYRKFSDDYIRAENVGKGLKEGMWKGKFEAPWEWRAAKRQAASSEKASRPCPIKGNVNSEGQQIYHLPGDRFFDQVRIKRDQGDQCFETEDEARAAGFRRSKR